LQWLKRNAAIGAIATAAKDPQNDWTGAIAPIVKL